MTDVDTSGAFIYAFPIYEMAKLRWNALYDRSNAVFTGLNRFWAVKEQLDTAAYRRHCERLAEAVAAAISVRVTKGEDVVLVGVEGSPSMGVTVTSSDPLRGGRPEWPDGTAEHVSGEGIFVEEIRKALAKRGIGFPRVAGETHALAGHDEAAQRAGLESALEG